MTSTLATDLKPDHYQSEQRPTLRPVPAETTPDGPDGGSFDPTQGRQIGSHPYDDPTQGRKIGSDPYDDPTRVRRTAQR
jgi:hypothetical protein